MNLSRTVAASLLLAVCIAPRAAELPPASAFFENSRFGSPKLSPDGRYLAARVSKPGERYRLSVVKLDDMSVKVAAMFGDADVAYFEWVNDNRLVFNGTDRRATFSDERFAAGLFAVNRDGSGYRQLTKTNFREGDDAATGSKISERLLDYNHYLLGQPGKQDSDEVYIVKYQINNNYTEITNHVLLRLNTVTGRTTPVSSPGKASDWLLDQQGEPRLAVNDLDKHHTVYVREGEQWNKLLESDAYGTSNNNFSPIGFGPDGALYVSARNNSDKSALYRYDLAKRQPAAEPLVGLDDYDFLPDFNSGADDDSLIVRDNKLVGVRYNADVRGVAWLDAKGKALQDKIDKLLPGLVNVITLPKRPEAPWVLVASYSDVQPLVHLVYNTETGKLVKVGASHDAIRPEQMGHQELVRYKARDGMQIPALLTIPRGAAKKNLPLVVLVHGGPYVHGSDWGWNADAQFLASRGYMVLEPAYRGSTGYGWQHFRAGWKQWGLKMQDDIADGARWAIAQGYADGKRICIAGASYGGYATLMGLVNDPDLYKCGVNWAGVTDIKLMYTGAWSAVSDMSDRWLAYGAPTMIGDPASDAAQLAATSPLVQAARIKQPLLLAYGGDDRRVPLYHGEKFLSAVKVGNPDIEWIVYDKEGHGWRLPQNRIDFWNRVEKFLDHQIGAAH
ncbi:prolyl oligopeptidase family serine peptidase [Duganella sp. FT135W]|uniref:Prolyl oligopeptidase family serine peptidase n=1 Tax=Duganella flavida TaxID=2692175 RepID=A0A6L8KA19_9BURK|nr:prolyl oligopeptidase family serine peptidase [Duganella flavida]MYM23457.1 prolyl oligopeptidase family serine peptidase [Duganella flavida]